MKIFLISLLLITIFANNNVTGKEMKKIEFTKGQKITQADISDLKQVTGKELPNWYIEHFMEVSGLKRSQLKDHEIEDNTHVDFTAVFEDGGSDGDHITDFMTVDQIKQVWPYINYLEDDIENFEISSSFVRWEHLFPLAGTGDGTIYVAIGGDHDRAVYEADNGDFGIGRVADDLDDFIASLGITVKSD